ncbi:MAG: ABC transporter permease [Clostridia bacterium]|nr:ABC transporter permease [Clostridia bacterium]MBR1684586.1 ABC transporter permease [Clostridia bacterium]MBR2288796.1 ABC transporter permease [Clostridia bacterium]
MEKKGTPLLRKPGVQTLIASLLCIVLGLFIGYIALLIINPAGAGEAILAIVKNFWTYSKQATQIKNLGNTLVKTAPLLMCSLSVLFAYKVGLFNIGAAGQYVAGAGASIYCAVALGWGWLPCMLMAVVSGAVIGAISGALKAYRNVNEVISCIMLNWITLYLVNTLLSAVKEPTSNYTYAITKHLVTVDGVVTTEANPGAVLPSLGLENLFSNNKYVGLAIPLAIVLAIAVWVLLNKTRLGYELRATGLNKNAAKYCGMRDRQNIVLTMAISGGLAGIGASMLYLTSIQQWSVTQSSVPGMGFNGIAAAFLGGLNPIGAIFSSFFIQHITDGGSYLDMRVYSAEISDFISSLIIYLCGFVLFFKTTLNRRLDKREEKKIQADHSKGGQAS